MKKGEILAYAKIRQGAAVIFQFFRHLPWLIVVDAPAGMVQLLLHLVELPGKDLTGSWDASLALESLLHFRDCGHTWHPHPV